MTIKDLESKVGVSKTNIRYYEREGLLTPKRNEENNYREYSQEDVAQLERIKVLRILGVPISDIRRLGTGKTTLDQVMEHRLALIKEEEKNLEAVRRVCENIRQMDLSYDAVAENLLDEDNASWNEQLARVLKEDITKEILTPGQFRTNLALMLIWGYCINTVITLFFGDQILLYNIHTESNGIVYMFPTAIILEAALYFIVYFSANIKAQAVIFHLNAFCLSTVIAGAYLLIHTCINISSYSDILNDTLRGTHMSIFWLAVIVYVTILYILSGMWSRFLSKARYVLLTALVYSAAAALLCLYLEVPSGILLPAALGLFFFTIYISLSWFHSYQDSRGKSRYFAISEGCRIMNLLGAALNLQGHSQSTTTYR